MTRIAAFVSVLMLSACVSLTPDPGPAPQMFVLEAGETSSLGRAPLDVVVGVAAPGGERTLLSSDLVWRSNDTLAYVAQAQWSGRAQDLLRTLVVQTLSRQGGARAVVRTGDAATQYEVRWTLSDFEVVEAGLGGEARFAADVMLVEANTRRVVASTSVATTAPVATRSASQAAQGLARAAREGSARMGVFAFDAIAADQAARAAQEASAASINR